MEFKGQCMQQTMGCCITATIVLLCVCGVLLSLYAIQIEQLKHADENYKATCDLDETISCSQVLTSEYSVGFGLVSKLLGEDHVLNVPNSYGGLVFFPLMLILSLFSSSAVVLLAVFLSLLSCVGSVYLIYILFYVLNKICLICMPVHFINLFLFILFTIKWMTMGSSTNTRSGGNKQRSSSSNIGGGHNSTVNKNGGGSTNVSPRKKGRKAKAKKEQ